MPTVTNSMVCAIEYTTEYGNAPNAVSLGTVDFGTSNTKNITLTESMLPALSADGYTFKGWAHNDVILEAGTEFTLNYPDDSTIVFVAVWEEASSNNESNGAYTGRLQDNNEWLESILTAINELPEEGSFYTKKEVDAIVENITPADIGAVNKAGDIIPGNLVISNEIPIVQLGNSKYGCTTSLLTSGHEARIEIAHGVNVRVLQLFDETGQGNIANALRLADSFNGNVSAYPVLHTGNKPTGSYTGNGSAAMRRIETGGIGSVIAIFSGYGVAFATGGVCHLIRNDGNVDGLAGVSFYNGVLSLAVTDPALNISGVEYTYQVL